MGGNGEKDTRTQGQKDQDEFGSVDNVHDLDPATTQKGAKSQQKEQTARLASSDAAGYFEKAGPHIASVSDLHVDKDVQKYAQSHGGNLLAFELGFNQYAQPLRSTLRSMGRVKDLSVAGASLTPGELQQSAAGKQMHTLNPTQAGRAGKDDATAQMAFASWSQSQTNMKTKIDGFSAGQIQLQAAFHGYTAGQKILQQKRTELQRDAKQSELNKINETAETLAKITEVSIEAWNAYGEISEALEATAAFDKDAKDEAGDIKADGHDGEFQGKAGKAVDKSSAALDAAKMGNKIAKEVNHRLLNNTLKLDLKEVFLIANGDAQKYLQLQADIAKLEGNIKQLGLDSQMESVAQSNQALTGWNATITVARNEVRNARRASRQDASNYADQMGVQRTAMYAAEASFELAEFGELASKERKAVAPEAAHAANWIQDHAAYFRSEPAMIGDVENILEHSKGVHEAGKFFGAHLPEWKKNADEWNAYFKSQANQAVISNGNAADRGSNAP